jgi:hypothetical protein
MNACFGRRGEQKIKIKKKEKMKSSWYNKFNHNLISILDTHTLTLQRCVFVCVTTYAGTNVCSPYM